MQTDHQPELIRVNKKKTHQLVDFALPMDHRVEIKVSKKIDKYLDLARVLKKQRNMKVPSKLKHCHAKQLIVK